MIQQWPPHIRRCIEGVSGLLGLVFGGYIEKTKSSMVLSGMNILFQLCVAFCSQCVATLNVRFGFYGNPYAHNDEEC